MNAMEKVPGGRAFVLALLLVLLALGRAPAAVAQDTVSLAVQVDGLRNSKGQITFCLWRESAKGFPRCDQGQPAAKLIAPAAKPAVTFIGLAPGKYAVSIEQDEDGDGRADTNFLGIPSSAVGLSNNPKPSIGSPPRFDSAGFDVSADKTITINALYPGS